MKNEPTSNAAPMTYERRRIVDARNVVRPETPAGQTGTPAPAAEKSGRGATPVRED